MSARAMVDDDTCYEAGRCRCGHHAESHMKGSGACRAGGGAQGTTRGWRPNRCRCRKWQPGAPDASRVATLQREIRRLERELRLAKEGQR